MAKSMTAFGRAIGTWGGKKYTIEIKSVNGRFFDCTVKYPRQYGFIEEPVKAYIQERGVSRGKIDVTINVEVIEQEGVVVSLDSALAASYIDALRRLAEEFDLKDDITVSRVAQFRDIFTITKPEENLEAEWEAVKSVLSEALDAFLIMREREGARLAADTELKLVNIEAIAAEIARLSSAEIASYAPRLTERIKQLLGDCNIEINEQRILTEAAIFADKASIDEELVRLASHITAFRQIIAEEGAVGRKLDFLTQEINREVNTIGSKSQNTKIAHLVVDMKSEIEKIREQVQNLE
ncbi:MAG TPA: YicC family protein [Bacillota bacterium]|nr:YicC family protein [Clostridiales bacterium]HOQ14506.1 YicC family protein [Bacillota bacterium]HPU17054.1 YicC family protein [Bacillota bacterium]